MVTPAPAWPGGKPFGFTIVDDTDRSTLENTKPVYDLLAELGFRTTKTVFPLRPRTKKDWPYGSLEDPRYRDWILDLQKQGFEIAMHGTSDEASPRERIEEGLRLFSEVVGRGPRMHVNHIGQNENIYWYADRLVGPPRWAYMTAQRVRGRHGVSLGHVAGSPSFWGDLVQSRIDYVRNFTFSEINTLKMDPWMPYHSKAHPYVKLWYSASQGTDCRRFKTLVDEAAQDRLAAEGGGCVLYTHFGFGYVRDGKLDPDFVRLMKRLASLGGYVAPASDFLDGLRARPAWKEQIGAMDLQRLQIRWLYEKFRVGTK